MYSTNRLDLPNTATTTPDRRTDAISGPRVQLPRRIDVHRIDAVIADITEAGGHEPLIDVDGAAVEMIDGFGLTALDELARTVPLSIRNASVALSKTAEYTGHDRLRAACAPLAIFPLAS